MKTTIIAFSLVCVLILCVSDAWAVEKTIYSNNAKALGMGNTKVAGGFNYNGFVDNPALLARVTPFRLTLFNLPFTINKNFGDIAGFISQNADNFKIYDELTEADKFKFLKDIEQYDALWTRIKFNPMIDISGSSFSPVELGKINDSRGVSYKDDKESIKKAIEENNVVFTVFLNDTVAFGKDPDNPGSYYVSRDGTESKKVFDSFDKAYSYWARHYRKQYDEGWGAGLAVFNNSTIGLKLDRGVYEPRVWGQGISDLAAVVGVAKSLTLYVPGLTVGVNLKFFQRRMTDVFQIKASELGNAIDTIQPVLKEAEANKTSELVADIGMLWDVALIGSEVAATWQSIDDSKGSSFDIGITKRLYRDRIILLADCIDVFDNNRENFFRKLHFGAQGKMAIFCLRAGINSGYPTAGIGLNFKILDLDLAYFTEELSNTPGLDEDTRYIMQLKLGW